MTVQLYGFGESGNAYKCALALRLAGIPYDLRFVAFFNGGTRTPAFRALNGMGEVPVLVDGDEVLTQSGNILYHIAGRTGQFLAPGQDKDCWRWVLWDNHKFSTQCGTARFLMNFLAAEKRSTDVIAFLQGRLKAALKVLDTHLDGRDWIVGDGLTVADLSCCAYLYYPEPFGFARHDWPNIDRWLANIAALPNWAHPYDLMQRAFPAQGGPT
jgi:glutathione S-transferase